MQLCGRRRVLLVAAEHALPGLAPFPALHPYDGYRWAGKPQPTAPAHTHTMAHLCPA